MSRNLTAQDRSSLIRLASSLPAGNPTRKAIIAGLQLQSSAEKVAYGLGQSDDDLRSPTYDWDDEGDEAPREPLSVADVADAIFVQSDRRRGDFVSREELLGIAMKELGRYGNKERDVDFLLPKAIKLMVRDRDLIPHSDAYLGDGYKFPR